MYIFKPVWLDQNAEWFLEDATSGSSHELGTSYHGEHDDKCAKESHEFLVDQCYRGHKRICTTSP